MTDLDLRGFEAPLWWCVVFREWSKLAAYVALTVLWAPRRNDYCHVCLDETVIVIEADSAVKGNG